MFNSIDTTADNHSNDYEGTKPQFEHLIKHNPDS